MDEQGIEAGGLKTGGPTYHRMNMAMMALTVVLSYDFMATFLTIYFYYQAVTDGSFERFYGIFFASYQIGLFVGSPIMAKWAEIRNIREPSVCCLALNVIGNLMYVFANATEDGSWFGFLLLLGGRGLAGFGAAGLTVSMLYLAQICHSSQRIIAMNTYRFWQFLGKFIAPLVGTACLYLPAYDIGSFSLTGATYPPITTAALGAVTIVPVVLFSIDIPKPDGPRVSLIRDKAARPMLRDALIVSAMYTFGSMCIWIVFSQVMTIGVVLFQIADSVEEASNLWWIYIPPIIGAVGSMIVVKRIIKSGAVQDFQVMGLGALGLAASLLFFFQYKSKEASLVYFIGGSLLFLSNGTFLTAYRGVYARIVGDSPHVEMMMSVMIMGLCLGGILGSLISGSVLSVQQIDECSSACIPSEYQYECCEMVGLNPVVLLGLLCMGGVLLAYAALFIPKSRLPTLNQSQSQPACLVQEDEHQQLYGGVPASEQFA